MKPPYSKHILSVPFLIALCYVPGMWVGGGGVLLGILGGGVPSGSQNSDPISDQKM